MNIGIIIPALEKYGGAERYLVNCLWHWQHRHKITLYATAISDQLLAEHGVDQSIKRVLLRPMFEGEHAFALNTLLLPKLWRSEIDRHDIYHAHLWPTHLVDLHPMVWFPHEPLRVLHDLRLEQETGPAGRDAARHVHIYPKFHYDRIGDPYYEGTLAAIAAADVSAVPDVVVANSRYTAGYLEKVYGRPVDDVVYPGVDIDQHIDLPIDKNLFVTIGQLWPHKRIGLLIESMALTDAAQLIVIGAGPELDRLQTLAAKLGVDDRVFFLSGLSNFDLSLILARACAFLFFPIREPFGIVVLEAMAAAKPIIAADEGGYVEACRPDFATLIAPHPAAIAAEIRRFQANPQEASAMGRKAREAVQPFTWQRAAEELESILIRTAAASSAVDDAMPTRDGPLVGIQYYLWYGEGYGSPHWNDDPRFGQVLDHPVLGYYASERGRVIHSHLEAFEAMGVDFAVLNLHLTESGLNPIELMSLQHVFDVAEQRNTSVQFAVQIAPYSDSVLDVTNTVALLAKLYAKSRWYLQRDGKPVLFWFWSTANDGNRALIEAMSQSASAFCNVAMSLRLPDVHNEPRLTFGFFDGMAPFSPLELAAERHWERVWSEAYAAASRAGMPIRLVSVSPGYDDRALTDPRRIGNPYRLVARKDGETYQRSLAFAEGLAPAADFVVVSTFNEYHENTHIEASTSNGEHYLDLTRDFVTRLKGSPSHD